jgi:predicted ABC-type ATPase
MAQDAVTEATDRKLNFTLDGAGAGGYDSMKERTDNARRGGHRIHAVYVTSDTDEAVRRAEERGKQTGRYIPEPIIRAAHQSVTDTFRDAIARGGLFDSAELWDNNSETPKLVGELKPGGTWTVHDQDAWQSFLSKGTSGGHP